MTADVALKDLLHFFSNFSNWEETDYLYEQINSFFTQHYPHAALAALSLPKDDGIEDKKTRIVWNRDSLSEEDKNIIYSMIEKKGMSSLIKENFIKETSSPSNYYLAFLGEEESQHLFLCLRLVGEVKEETLCPLLSFSRHTYEQNQKWKEQSKQSSLIHIDDVTGLYNQRKLYKDLQGLIRRYERSGENFALLFIDIDHFKNVNDNYGHLIGTKLLSDLGKVLRRTLRDTDFIYRYGGDEFVAIVPDASTNDARLIGDRILKTVRDEHFRIEEEGQVYRISISVGIASFPRDAKDGKEVLELADRMMYRAKNKGRGRVCLAADFYSDS